MRIITTATVHYGSGDEQVVKGPGTHDDMPDEVALDLLERGHATRAPRAGQEAEAPQGATVTKADTTGAKVTKPGKGK